MSALRKDARPNNNLAIVQQTCAVLHESVLDRIQRAYRYSANHTIKQGIDRQHGI